MVRPLLLLLALMPAATLAQLLPEGDGAPPENVLVVQLREEGLAYEHGEGVERDLTRAIAAYCKAARRGDVKSQYALGWLYTNGRGVERNDSLAAFFFQAAAEQGDEPSQRMLRTVGGPTTDVPDCMREPPPPPPRRAEIRRPADAPLVVPPQAPKPIVEQAVRTANEMKVHPQLVLAIIEAESNFNVAALSPRNARGLMQLIPETAERFGVRNSWDAAQNIRGGVSYLRWLLAYFEGDVALAAAAYNAGEGAVNKYRGIPPYVETRDYVRKILASVGRLTVPFDATATAPSPYLRAIRAPRLGG